MLLSLFAIMLFFQVMTDGTLLQPLNLTNLVLQNSYIVIMALGMLLVIVTGHIDLSVGSVAGFIGAVAAVLMVRYHVAYPLAFLACLLVGALIGAAQGYWVAYFKIPSFIVTLAGMLVFKGLALAILQGQSVGPFPPTFQKLSSGFIPELFPGAGALYPTSLLIGRRWRWLWSTQARKAGRVSRPTASRSSLMASSSPRARYCSPWWSSSPA